MFARGDVIDQRNADTVFDHLQGHRRQRALAAFFRHRAGGAQAGLDFFTRMVEHAEGDEVLPVQVGGADRLAPGQRVIGRNRSDEVEAGQHAALDQRILEKQHADRQIELALGHQFDQLFRTAGVERGIDTGVPLHEAGQQIGQPVARQQR